MPSFICLFIFLRPKHPFGAMMALSIRAAGVEGNEELKKKIICISNKNASCNNCPNHHLTSVLIRKCPGKYKCNLHLIALPLTPCHYRTPLMIYNSIFAFCIQLSSLFLNFNYLNWFQSFP